MLSFLLGSGFMITARRSLRAAWKPPFAQNPQSLVGPERGRLQQAGTMLGRAGQELVTIATNPRPNSESLEQLNATVAQLRDTLQQTEDIVNSINDIGSFPEKPSTGME